MKDVFEQRAEVLFAACALLTCLSVMVAIAVPGVFLVVCATGSGLCTLSTLRSWMSIRRRNRLARSSVEPSKELP